VIIGTINKFQFEVMHYFFEICFIPIIIGTMIWKSPNLRLYRRFELSVFLNVTQTDFIFDYLTNIKLR